MFDEYHEYAPIAAEAYKKIISLDHGPLVYGFTATPPQKDFFPAEAFRYTRQQAVRDGVLVSPIIDKLGVDYSLKAFENLI